MLAAIAQMILPAIVVFTTLFGVMARRDPKPGGVALFLRVGLMGLALAALIYYPVVKTALVTTGAGAVAINVSRGLGMGGGLLVVMALIGVMLKKQQ
ncbi:MAG TPA: hypothetical protein VN903_12710 [Polyangia bacterium]|jgi:hypothetical protein|nr:hypothetical protein [Polyangia bacterium]